jgi:hypothetical protein
MRFIGSAIKSNHHSINLTLILGIHADHNWRNFGAYIFYCTENPFAKITLAAIAKFYRFNAPVDAPLGTAARDLVPSASAISTSTVGFPRESRISRAEMVVIADTVELLSSGLESIATLLPVSAL